MTGAMKDRPEQLRKKTPAPHNPAADSGGARPFASPPCFLPEVDPAYLGYLSRSETLALLNRLLEGERAGARALAAMGQQAAPDKRRRSLLRAIAQDEAQFCAMLTRHIVRLGATPSRRTGAFYDQMISSPTTEARIELLERGQAWVVRKLQEALPKICDDELHLDLKIMLEVHQHNIRRGTALR